MREQLLAVRREAIRWGGVTLIAFLLASCAGTLSVGIEQTPTADPAPAATLVALQDEVDRLAAELATAVAPPTGVPSTLGRVAYIRGGDLWFAVAPAGPHQRLTIDGVNREPHWSPSGEWLAYRKDRSVLLEREVPCDDALREGEPPCRDTVSTEQEQVWIMRRTGEASRVINLGLTVERFAWSPRQDQLAYVNDQGHLQLLDPVDDTEYRLVSAGSGARVANIAWSADGLTIAYEWLADDESPLGAGSSGIFVIQAAGGQPALALRSGRSRAVLAGWSGSDLLVWQQGERAAQPEDGAALYAVTAPAAGELPAAPRVLAPEPMLPRRDFVAVAPLQEQPPVAYVTGIGEATWNNKRLATGAFRTPETVAATAPAWAPDGTRLAYVAMPDAPGLGLGADATRALLGRRIWVAAPANGAMRELTEDGRYRDERPQWSAQGSHILFARITSEGQASLWMIPEAGGAPQLVVDELTPAPDPIGNYGHIDWAQHFDWWRG